ncbi:uncharacterized protein LOC141618024 [Silene latifolia]|uniref:uncharacterized protein LOC141618024 n=1 Tax=Silene latifolia TaxID=37657 RepID=UPI003D775A2E
MAMDEVMDEDRSLFLITGDEEFQYCMYRVSESEMAPENPEDECTFLKLGQPILTMDKSVYPSRMSFVNVRTKIYMVGGYLRDGNNPPHQSKTFIYDTLSNSMVPGPALVSGKCKPYLLTIGSKIFALSNSLNCNSCKDSGMDPIPQFEVLDTEDIEQGWSALPLPALYSSNRMKFCSVDAWAAAYVGGTSSAIFISVKDGGGTYAFDVDKKLWNPVSDQVLPFPGPATPLPGSPNLPYAPTLCCASSLRSGRYAAFRFHYHAQEFRIDEIEIHNSPLLSAPLPPDLYLSYLVRVLGPNGRIYFLDCGVDDATAWTTGRGNVYFKVSALQVCKIKLEEGQKKKKKNKRKEMEHGGEENETIMPGSNKEHVLKICNKKRDSNKEQVLKKCKKKLKICKKKLDSNKEQVLKICKKKLGSNKEQVLKICKKKKMQKGNDEEKETTVTLDQMRNAQVEDETIELKMNHIWRRSLFAGPIVDILKLVVAAFAL